MKSKLMSLAAVAGILLLLTGSGLCQDKISMNEWVEKVGQGSVNWSQGYIEAVGIGAVPDRSIGKANARPLAMRAAKVDAYRNLLEITKGVQIDSATTVKDFMVESDVINSKVEGLVKGAQLVKTEYMSDGTVEITLRMPLYGGVLAQTIMPLAIAKPPVPPEPAPAPAVPAPVVAAPATPAPAGPAAYTGMVVDARGIQARPAMSPRVFDEDGTEVYGSANVDREYAVQQGMSGYARDLNAAQSNQRVTANPITVKAIRSSGAGRSDLIISNADARQIRTAADSMTFMKKCRVMVVLD